MGSTLFTSDLHVITIGIQAFIPSWYHGFYPGVEEIGVKRQQREIAYVGRSIRNLQAAVP
jgi:hypothetical protein